MAQPASQAATCYITESKAPWACLRIHPNIFFSAFSAVIRAPSSFSSGDP